MTDQQPAQVRFARRFVAVIPGQPDIHGVQFPDSGHVLADVPYTGLTAFLNADVITDEHDGAVIHWADEADEEQFLARADKVRTLHQRNEHTGDCEYCSARDYPDYAVPYPCDTVRALDGKEQR